MFLLCPPSLRLLCLFSLLGLSQTIKAADLQLASVFSDHMVLQRDKPVAIWGTSDGGASVVVEFADQQIATKASNDGQWLVTLQPMKASHEGRELKVTSNASNVVIADVLVGEVWILGGQSNMEMPLWWRGESDGLKSAPNTRLVLGTDHPWLRILTVPQQVAKQPQQNFRTGELDGDGVETSRWLVSKERDTAISGFSSLGYFIAVMLYEKLGVPVGMIDTSWGGTIASAWNSTASLARIPEAEQMIRRKYNAAAEWSKSAAEQAYAVELANWNRIADDAKAAGKQPPPKPEIKSDPGLDRNYPAGPFNAMVWPLRNLAIRGVFFYQGENNFFDNEDPFFRTFPGIVHSWRTAFSDAALPFCIFQICGWGDVDSLYEPTKLPEIQEVQHDTHTAINNTGFVVTTDYPHVDIHPMVKRVIAERALRWARAEIYGEKWLTWGSPRLVNVQRNGSRMLLTFDTSENEALLIKGVPCGLVICGTDGRYVEAQAKVVNRISLEVWSDKVAEPVAVRYAWSQRAICRLYSASGLPLGPFRTDTAPTGTNQN